MDGAIDLKSRQPGGYAQVMKGGEIGRLAADDGRGAAVALPHVIGQKSDQNPKNDDDPGEIGRHDPSETLDPRARQAAERYNDQETCGDAVEARKPEPERGKGEFQPLVYKVQKPPLSLGGGVGAGAESFGPGLKLELG